MLKQLRNFVLEGLHFDRPYISQVAIDYLQNRLNASFLNHSGKIKELQNEQRSESFILGFILGCEHASSLLDYIQQNEDKEEDT